MRWKTWLADLKARHQATTAITNRSTNKTTNPGSSLAHWFFVSIICLQKLKNWSVFLEWNVSISKTTKGWPSYPSSLSNCKKSYAYDISLYYTPFLVESIDKPFATWSIPSPFVPSVSSSWHSLLNLDLVFQNWMYLKLEREYNRKYQ